MILDGDKSQLDAYIRHIADIMGLRDWTIRIDIKNDVTADNHQSAEDGTSSYSASSQVLHGRQFVILSLDAGWSEWDADTLRQTVAHELVHAHTAKMLYAFYNVRNVIGGGALFDVLDSAYDDAHEITVDAIAVAWAETLPLPVKADDDEQDDVEAEDAA